LRKIHPNAFLASVATEAADLQGKFWEMHDIVFENQEALHADNIFRLADMIDVDPDRLKMDMQQKALIEKVENDFGSGLKSGVNRTPTFFINGEKYEGEWAGENLIYHLKSLLTGIIIS
jgi:protein-disulfide isomerase